MIECSWCGTRYTVFQLNCSNCGGPLPSPPGDDPGAPPAPPPRKLPRGYARRVLFSANALAIVGVVFTLVGLPFVIVFPIIGISTGLILFILIGGLLGGIFSLLGISFLVVSIRNVNRKLQAFRYGEATIGEVAEVYRDTSVSVNGRSPWVIVYWFEVSGEQYEGKATTWNSTAREREAGQPLHVLYLPDAPDHNTIYPPMK